MSSVAEVLTSSDRAWWRGRQLADLALRLILAFVTLALLATVAFLLTGGRALVVRSGSMEPAIATGDMAVTRTISPSEAQVGDVVTFKDPTRAGDLVTHRVVKMREKNGQIAFVTKGDSNTGVERWRINRNGSIGRFMFRIPKVGYATTWVTDPKVRALLVGGAALLFAIAALRRVWAN